MQVDLQEKKRDRWKGWNLQGTACGKGLHPKRRLRLRRDHLACSHDKIYQDPLSHCQSYGLENLANGCQNSFLEWKSWWDHLYGSTRRIHWKRSEKESVQAAKSPFMDLSRHQGLRTSSLTIRSNHLDLSNVLMSLVYTREVANMWWYFSYFI